MRSLGLLRCLLLTAPLAAAGLALPAGAEPEAMGVAEREASDGVQVTSARLEAELLRRMGGEWVIVSLTPLAPDPVPLSAEDPQTAADRSGVQAALHAYRSALESRDPLMLARVWIMNPAEQEQVQRLFAGSQSIRVTLEDPEVVVVSDRALARFQQRVVVSERPWWSLALRPASWRSLLARDETGTWALEDVVDGD